MLHDTGTFSIEVKCPEETVIPRANRIPVFVCVLEGSAINAEFCRFMTTLHAGIRAIARHLHAVDIEPCGRELAQHNPYCRISV